MEEYVMEVTSLPDTSDTNKGPEATVNDIGRNSKSEYNDLYLKGLKCKVFSYILPVHYSNDFRQGVRILDPASMDKFWQTSIILVAVHKFQQAADLHRRSSFGVILVVQSTCNVSIYLYICLSSGFNFNNYVFNLQI